VVILVAMPMSDEGSSDLVEAVTPSAVDVPEGIDETGYDGYPVALEGVPISDEDSSERVEEGTTPSAEDVPENVGEVAG
jgi:hypothetical protein